MPDSSLCRISLKQNLSLEELQQNIIEIRRLVEENPCSDSAAFQPLSCYMMPDEENPLANQVTQTYRAESGSETRVMGHHLGCDPPVSSPVAVSCRLWV